MSIPDVVPGTNWPSEEVTFVMCKSASPVFETVKQNWDDEPTLMMPKSLERGATLMTGPLTVVARAAASVAMDAVDAMESPGAIASARSATSEILSKARLRIMKSSSSRAHVDVLGSVMGVAMPCRRGEVLRGDRKALLL